jgi:hypothetical protein
MKKNLFIFLTLLLIGCSNTVSSTSSSSKVSNSTSSSSSSLISSSIISSTSSSSSSNEENKLEFEKEETSKKLILSSTNKTNTAYSSWEAEYLENGIQITSYVYDEDVFYGNIYNCGYDDNVEFLINVKNNETDEQVTIPLNDLYAHVLGAIQAKTNSACASCNKKEGE